MLVLRLPRAPSRVVRAPAAGWGLLMSPFLPTSSQQLGMAGLDKEDEGAGNIYSLYMEVIKIKVIVWTEQFCVPNHQQKKQ